MLLLKEHYWKQVAKNIKEMMGNEDETDLEKSDLTQQGFNSEQIHRANALGEQVDFANREMELLQNMLPTIEDINGTVKLGSVVVTDKDIFFVSASIERIEVDGQSVFGLSTQSPLCQAMDGKKAGEKSRLGIPITKSKRFFDEVL